MDAAIGKDVEVRRIIEAALRGVLTKKQARQLHQFGPEAVALAMLAAARRIAELQSKLKGVQSISPSTPSGQIPIYAKPKTPKRKGRPGAKKGHQGARRARPERIDDRKTHRLPQCPKCGGRLQRCQHTRTRIIEDIPEDIQPVATEHTIHRDYCPKCKRHVEPIVPDALPGATLGHRVIGLTGWLY